jgi:hypothetical protein
MLSRLLEEFSPLKLLRILKNDKQPVNCPACGKLMTYDSRRRCLLCENPKCNIIEIHISRNGSLRIYRQPERR